MVFYPEVCFTCVTMTQSRGWNLYSPHGSPFQGRLQSDESSLTVIEGEPKMVLAEMIFAAKGHLKYYYACNRGLRTRNMQSNAVQMPHGIVMHPP